METILIIGGIIIIAVIIILIVIAVRYYAKKRMEELEAAASSLNFSFSPKGDDSLITSLNQIFLFSQGHSKKIFNLMNRHDSETDIKIFDYRYTTGAGKHSSTFNQTVVLFKSSSLMLPRFTLRPENVFHKIGTAFGYQDIDFNSHPEFSKQYLLRGEDEQACRDAFTFSILEYYERQKGLSTEGDGDTLLFYRTAKNVRPGDIRFFFEEASEIFDRFKIHS